MNPNYDDDKYEVFEPKGIPGKFEKLDKECKAANSKIYNEEYKRDYPVQYAELKKKYPERYTE